MSEDRSKGQNNVLDMQASIRCGLHTIDEAECWLELYENWKENANNQFSSLLAVRDPFKLSCAGDAYAFDNSNADHMTYLDIIKMSIFLSEHLMQKSKEVFNKVCTVRNREKKLVIIETYLKLVDKITNIPELSGCIVMLYNMAEKQMVLQGSRSVDLYLCFYSLRELLRKETTESLYLLYTYWRITKNKSTLETLISAIIDYTQVYFKDYNNDPQMKLFYPTSGLAMSKKLAVVCHWFEMIAIHTEGIFEKYEDLKWLTPVDRMADEIVETAQISRFEMLHYKRVFSNDDNETVRKKAICNHGYAIWIKTVDVMHIFRDICQSLYDFSNDDLKRMNTTKAEMLELYDNMTKVRNYYTGKIFFHQVYFEQERHYFDSRVMKALEDDAEVVTKTFNDVLTYVEAISSDDIDALTQAKASYFSKIKDFSTEDQKDKLDNLTNQIAEKVKDAISKNKVYNDLYKSVSSEFAPYAAELISHPQIFSSLVSAEYLYKQYVEKREPNELFDYSCISIMYYMSLEDFINKLVFVPYSKDVLATIDRKYTGDNNWKKQDGKKYVSDFRYFLTKSGKIKDSCEIGTLGCLFEGVEGELFFKQYLIDRFQVSDFQRIKDFGTKLKNVAQRRNDAAHGGNYLSYDTVCCDKDNVYNTVVTYKGMILELMNILFKV